MVIYNKVDYASLNTAETKEEMEKFKSFVNRASEERIGDVV